MTRHALATVLASTALVGSALVTAAPAQAAPRPPQVHITGTAKAATLGTALVDVATQCFGGAVVQELDLEVAQPGVVATADTTAGIVCDGVRRVTTYRVTAGGPELVFGPAEVTARLTVLHPVSHDPLPQAYDARRVRLLPSSEFRVDRPVKLNSGDSVSVPVTYRCQSPWLSDGFGVTVSQKQGFVFGSAWVPGLVCDGVWRSRRVRVTSAADQPFREGPAVVTAGAQTVDPDNGDPVNADQGARVWRPVTRW